LGWWVACVGLWWVLWAVWWGWWVGCGCGVVWGCVGVFVFGGVPSR